MKSIPGSSFAIISILLLCAIFAMPGCSSPRSGPATSSNDLHAGMAEIDITAPVGYRMAGYFDERFATGVHDPLKAKALVLQQGGHQFALVFCDLVGLSLNVTTNARAQASALTGIPVTNIVIAATHSHTGPLFDDVREAYFHKTAIEKYGRDPHEVIRYPDFLRKQLVKVIQQAQSKATPASLDVGIARQAGMPFNRRYLMKNGRVAFNPGQLNPNVVRPAGPVDSDVCMLVVHPRNSGQPMGGLTVFAMHADTAGGTEFSADYPYFIEQTLRNALGKTYISAFGAGTCGDLNHINTGKIEPVKGFAVTERLGASIGETIVSSQPNLENIPSPSLASEDIRLMLPLQTPDPQKLAEARRNLDKMNDTNYNFYAKVEYVKALDLDQKGAIWPMEVQVFRIDKDTAIVCLPAELFVEFGLGIKKGSPFKNTFVISICNDRPCYIPTLKAFQEGSYEVTNSRLKAGAGERMVETALEMLNSLKP